MISPECLLILSKLVGYITGTCLEANFGFGMLEMFPSSALGTPVFSDKKSDFSLEVYLFSFSLSKNNHSQFFISSPEPLAHW